MRVARPSSVASSVLTFSISGVAALAVVGVVAVVALRNVGTSQAIQEATDVTEVVARVAIAPQLTDEVVAGDPEAIAGLDRLVKEKVLNSKIVRVKVWNRDGRILYSDEARLIGQTYPLDTEKASAFAGPSSADVSDLSGPENVYEPHGQELFEVYAPIRSVSNEPLLFEAYLTGTSIDSSARRTWLAFIPAVVLGLVVLELIQVPLAWSMARRIAKTQKERELLLTRAIEASDEERRRIAAGIHDGVVQDLVGLSFSLTAVGNRLDAEEQSDARSSVMQAAANTRNNIRQLRQLLVDIYPPSVHGAGLAAALSDLLSPLQAKGIAAYLDLPRGASFSPGVEALIFRVARESLQNVARHAEASRVELRLAMESSRIVLTVDDNGKGFVPADGKSRLDDGHFGLRLLRDMVAHAGGTFAVYSEPGRGTRVRLEVKTS